MKKLIICLLLILPLFAQAGAYTGKSKINWLTSRVTDAEGKHFVISGAWANKLNCSKMDQGIWKIYSSTDSIEELQSMYSMAMTAYMGEKTIELYSHRCGSDGRPHARSLYLPSRTG